jgi:hypothetical protein
MGEDAGQAHTGNTVLALEAWRNYRFPAKIIFRPV